MEKEFSNLRSRLIEAAKTADKATGFHILIWPEGVIIRYVWEIREGKYHSVENTTSWEEIEDCPTNPLLSALTSLTKQASKYQ